MGREWTAEKNWMRVRFGLKTPHGVFEQFGKLGQSFDLFP